LAEEARTRAEVAGIAASTGSEVANARSSSQTLAQQRARLRGERAYVVTAPVAGRVTALQAAVGRTVDAGIPLMVIVPEGSKLHADIYAPSRAIGFVKPGQEVRLLYDAFPYQRFGSFTGRIARVSRTAMDPRELNVPLKIEEAVYRIEVTPGAQAVNAFGERLPLQPGMTLRANIVLDRRSFGEWLLQPLNAVLKRNQ
jgi:membrane fusion protein